MDIDIQSLESEWQSLSAEEVVKQAVLQFSDTLTLASSLGAEDQVLTQMILSANRNARIFILDTGRLNPETYNVMSETQTQYGFNYDVYFPQTDAVQNLVSQKGPNSFYESIDNRKECCQIRKVEPLQRALSGAKAWITGIRRSQSPTRANTPLVEWDASHGLFKINPLVTWSEEDVWAYIKTHQIPYNALHDQGYPSIGCAPCTRAIQPNEDSRAGRWWWEEESHKECGLHFVDGKAVRKPREGKTNGPFG